MVIILHPL
jgi:hypothetical protein